MGQNWDGAARHRDGPWGRHRAGLDRHRDGYRDGHREWALGWDGTGTRYRDGEGLAPGWNGHQDGVARHRDVHQGGTGWHRDGPRAVRVRRGPSGTACRADSPVPALPCPPRRYMCSLSLFHYSEYLVTAINNPRSLSLDSFLLNHSFEYNLAALSSWVEFTLEKLLVPGQPRRAAGGGAEPPSGVFLRLRNGRRR